MLGVVAVTGGAGVAASGCAGDADVVVTGGVSAQRAAAYRQLVLDAITPVEDLWGAGSVPLPVRIDLPLTTAQWAAATGYAPDQRGYAASTVRRSPQSGGARSEVRIVMHPDAWSELTRQGRQAVAVHEVAHLAMGPAGEAPWWVEEGMAEYTAHRRSSLSMAKIAGSALTRVIASPSTSWPRPQPGSNAWDGYASAWLACRFIAERHGEAALIELWEALSDSRSLEESMQLAVGESAEQVLRHWQDWLATL